jgi:hypothetical protein
VVQSLPILDFRHSIFPSELLRLVTNVSCDLVALSRVGVNVVVCASPRLPFVPYHPCLHVIQTASFLPTVTFAHHEQPKITHDHGWRQREGELHQQAGRRSPHTKSTCVHFTSELEVPQRACSNN